MNVDKIYIQEIFNELGHSEYWDVTINGDTWSCKTKKDCIEMINEVLLNGSSK